jgi:hypothetical protein
MRVKRGDPRFIDFVPAAWAAPVWAQDMTIGEDPASQKPVTKVIQGRVVDEAGQPVAGITLSTHWIRQEDQPVRAVSGVARTDEQGQFRIELTFDYSRSDSLCALDVERRRGGLAVVGPNASDGPITIEARPLVHVHGKYVCNELGTPVGRTSWWSSPGPARGRPRRGDRARGPGRAAGGLRGAVNWR